MKAAHRQVALAQAAYYLPTAIWPLASIRTFQHVTGPKRDLWLVKTVATLIGVIGCVLGAAARSDRVTPEISLLGVSSALGLTGIDLYYVARRRISPIYLLDALSEVAIVILWIASERRMRRD